MKSVNPYLNFAGNTEEAFQFYQSVFGGQLEILRFRDFGENTMGIPEADLDKVAHAALPLGADNILMGTDVLESLGQKLSVGNNTYIALETDTRVETEELFDKLTEGGAVEMPLQEVTWAECYGIVRDKFDVQWMFTYAGTKTFKPE